MAGLFRVERGGCVVWLGRMLASDIMEEVDWAVWHGQ